MDLTGWMLSRLVPAQSARFRELVRELASGAEASFVLAELNAFLSSLGASELVETVEVRPDAKLDDLRANQLAAMVEMAAGRLGVRAPGWLGEIPPLELPWFASNLVSLRLHLLTRSPPAFRRRNLFVDSTLGDTA
jgi:hypothetical protein